MNILARVPLKVLKAARIALRVTLLLLGAFLLMTGTVYLIDPPSLQWHDAMWFRIFAGITFEIGGLSYASDAIRRRRQPR